ncbi:T-lymphocyte activation antigen CD80-like [Sander lucioperca]|uniref:T-lymphocyte activation antigen CD80-like n=1 Tax=Sander lucioperca TaxID=283035 RepID=UPI00125D1967|nr:T-lymphocyte activation antigen CD80-like [Sander lucioperca]XP_031145566.1 T-lymphocyte activation antigen CD80-like [Sander lucioperca]
MFIISVACFLLLVSDATDVLHVNTTVGEFTVLPCILMLPATTGLKQLRFYWQDDRAYVLYSFNEGKEMPEHVNELYRDRITAFPQDMTGGNISVKLQYPTLEDNHRVFHAFAAVFASRGIKRYIFEHREICQMTLHVAVPYENISLTVNEETMTAVCTIQRGFPKPLVEWRLQSHSDNTQHLLDPQDVNSTAVQDPQDHLYSLTSTIVIPGGPYQSVACLVHNPTLNVTLIATHILNKGEAERSRPSLAGALMVAAAAVLIY